MKGSNKDFSEVRRLYKELVRFKGSIRSEGFTVEVNPKVEEIMSNIKEKLILTVLTNSDIELARMWVKKLRNSLSKLSKILNIEGILLSKEVKSFIEDPLNHLKKKLFIYTHDLVRGSMTIDDYIRTSAAAVRTSYRTNLRTIYQVWVISELISSLSEYGKVRLVYPEYGYLTLDRSGKQKTGIVPPNAIIEVNGKYLSIFIEAPRPVGWEDSSDLRRSWKLYTALRPDIMIYEGKVLNIVRLGQEPPILRPNIIIECKELEDWYLRVRDVRGPFAKPLTAEEWRNKWIRGLWAGLSEVLGISSRSVNEIIKERRGVRLREYQIVALYKRVYKPDVMYLVSLHKIPNEVRKYLDNEGIRVVDDVGFKSSKLREISKKLYEFAKESEETIVISNELKKKILNVAQKLGIRTEGEISTILEEVLDNIAKIVSKSNSLKSR